MRKSLKEEALFEETVDQSTSKWTEGIRPEIQEGLGTLSRINQK